MKKELFLLVHLSMNFCSRFFPMEFDRNVWNKIVDKCVEYGYTGIVLDVGDGMKYKSHPEIAIDGAWSREEMQEEVRRLRGLGVNLIPKLNFSAAHDLWLGKYREQRSTPEYYSVCKDLIEELYEVFEEPEYFHVGLDEEFPDMASTDNRYRTGDTLFKDYLYMINCVKSLGAKCMMWSSTCMHNPDLWEKYIPNDVIFTIGQYYEFEQDRWTKIADQDEDVREYYWGGAFEKRNLYQTYLEQYGNTKIEYVEQDDTIRMFMDFAEKIAKKNGKLFIYSSNFYIKTNPRSAVEYYHKWKYKDSIIGFFGLPWVATIKENENAILEEIESFGAAKKEFFD